MSGTEPKPKPERRTVTIAERQHRALARAIAKHNYSKPITKDSRKPASD
jgi:hypothetical protein